MRPRVQFVSGGVVHSSCASTEGLIQAQEDVAAQPCWQERAATQVDPRSVH